MRHNSNNKGKFYVFQNITDNKGCLDKDDYISENDIVYFDTWLEAATAAYKSYMLIGTDEEFSEESLHRFIQIKVVK